jgi:hypothetical protein
MRLGKQHSEAPPTIQPDIRTALHKPITVLKTDGNGGSKTFFGYAKNISRGGMMIGATNPREPGSRFLLEIPLPDPINLVVTCKCEVVWKRQWVKNSEHEPGMGLRFIDLPEDIAAAIDDWVERRTLQRQLWN